MEPLQNQAGEAGGGNGWGKHRSSDQVGQSRLGNTSGGGFSFVLVTYMVQLFRLYDSRSAQRTASGTKLRAI